MPVMQYYTTHYFWLTWPNGLRVGSADALGPSIKGYCSECGADSGLEYYWFLIGPDTCAKCGHEFKNKRISAYESCGGHYEYADKLIAENHKYWNDYYDEKYGKDN